MQRIVLLFLLLAALGAGASMRPAPEPPTWGFFAHKRINRLAVMTLPPEMMVFKKNIDYITDHAVDPDMRRYASKHEGPRHFIDLDMYGPPFDSLPRLWPDALLRYCRLYTVNAQNDTSVLLIPAEARKAYRYYISRHVTPRFFADDPTLDADSLRAFLARAGVTAPNFQSAFMADAISEHGVLPWHLQKMQRDLTEAFRQRDGKRILRLSAEMGHYIGDGHVPLHTCSNYNGQKTGQHGIHGFWESRIPELFADESYDYFVGKPEYLNQSTDFFWSSIYASHSMVDSVLTLEKQLRKTYPSDRQMCPDMRLGVMVVAPCRDFAAAYQDALQNMIERRMRAAIHAVSSAWYTAWVDAGQPDLSKVDIALPSEAEVKEAEQLKKDYQKGKIMGREEEH
jgi:hypothetical protein